jgi:hypothetical protein
MTEPKGVDGAIAFIAQKSQRDAAFVRKVIAQMAFQGARAATVESELGRMFIAGALRRETREPDQIAESLMRNGMIDFTK